MADITGLDIFTTKWTLEDWLICSEGVWECLNKEDIKRDRRDLRNNPKGYISDVLGLDEWKRRWERIKGIDYAGQWRDFTDDPGGYFDRKWNFTKERMGSLWADISQAPGNYAKDLLLDAIGWYDVQAWWKGRDPQTGERLRVENRKMRLLLAVPIPQTKGAKVAKMGIGAADDLADFAIDLACAKRKGKGGCKDDSEGWVMSRDGPRINGRWYTIHALERMAPDNIQVRAELEKRALERGYPRGSDDFMKYVDPRGIPPMVVEHTIQTGIRMKNKKRFGTWLHFGEDIIAVTNDNGDVVTVYRLNKGELKRLLNRGYISEEEYKLVLKERNIN